MRGKSHYFALVCGCSGQSTLEYALVMFALLASIVAMGVVLGFVQDPSFFKTVIDGSAHVLTGSDAFGAVQDLAAF